MVILRASIEVTPACAAVDPPFASPPVGLQTVLTGWGRYPRHRSELAAGYSLGDIRALLTLKSGLIPRGAGRSYGDAAIGEHVTVSGQGLRHMLSFDPATGLLAVEAGVLLRDVLDTFGPRGYVPPVVPGSQDVTIGGMIAADVHGKNHHRDGGFGDHLESLTLVLPGGAVEHCSPESNPQLFAATVGGMGLTGMIVEATFRMRAVETGWILRTTTAASDLQRTLQAMDHADGTNYCVAWVDALAGGSAVGRSLVFKGNHASREQVEAQGKTQDLWPNVRRGRWTVPFDLPGWMLNRLTVSAFNRLYFSRGSAESGASTLVPWARYFFPLDGVRDWNRMYGRRGFLQHQCVLPAATAASALPEILDRFRRAGRPPCMAVLKRLREGRHLMSFPQDGYTLAVDLPFHANLFPLLDAIDQIVVAAGGRIYLAKDARQSRDTLDAGYAHAGEFRSLRRAISATGHIESKMSRRLEL